MTDEHRMLQDSAARFFRERWVPQAAKWREEGQMPLETWREAGANGLLCASARPRNTAAAAATSATTR